VNLAEIKEGRARILVPDVPRLKGPGRKHAGFYNPLMAFNRDVSVRVLSLLARQGKVKRPLDGMAGTGVRGLRWALEADGIEVGMNEPAKVGADLVRRNVELNQAPASVYASGIASATMEHRADLVDIDPFGSPVPYFFPVVQNIRRGFVSVTATDTAALAGTVSRVAARRYMTTVSRTSVTHEVGLRALVGALVRDAARLDRELVPFLSYHADHYYRAYLALRRSAAGADRALGMVRKETWEGRELGPLWTGRLCDPEFLDLLARTPPAELEPQRARRAGNLFALLKEESSVQVDGRPVFGFLRVDNLARQTGTQPLSPAALVSALRESGFAASRTHFDPGGVKTDATGPEVAGIVARTGRLRRSGAGSRDS
jgi:tRNA (guanine26-N2/guanine27-N2)-dimethyltransferase